jgi:hypothetical protein
MSADADHEAWRAVLDAMWADLETPLGEPVVAFKPPDVPGPIPDALRADARALLAAQAHRAAELQAMRSAVEAEFGDRRRSRTAHRRPAPSPTSAALSL